MFSNGMFPLSEFSLILKASVVSDGFLAATEACLNCTFEFSSILER